ncbi:hypothetical protein [Longimicrobium terrae]|uniref:Uncharacterized protein n=1 Tax=Longimicrobium terrae TaxID=1639882 RepID=A0A841H5U4_9BACT|nr:hypothetical protein [Longimicrobium terrae]MBB4639051.1 hypothetical protein [Longimicrobium terrae]MBB6073348.1 hypothetical protein [Longimicrobium terrae]NNC28787.1 hypothetical protein [Longimicrobium terrae]
MATDKRTARMQPFPGSRFDLDKVTEMFREMRIAHEAGIPYSEMPRRSIRDILNEEGLRTWPDLPDPEEEAA